MTALVSSSISVLYISEFSVNPQYYSIEKRNVKQSVFIQPIVSAVNICCILLSVLSHASLDTTEFLIKLVFVFTVSVMRKHSEPEIHGWTDGWILF